VAERQAAVREAAEARAKSAELVEELEALRAERKQVRTRVENCCPKSTSLPPASNGHQRFRETSSSGHHPRPIV